MVPLWNLTNCRVKRTNFLRNLPGPCGYRPYGELLLQIVLPLQADMTRFLWPQWLYLLGFLHSLFIVCGYFHPFSPSKGEARLPFSFFKKNLHRVFKLCGEKFRSRGGAVDKWKGAEHRIFPGFRPLFGFFFCFFTGRKQFSTWFIHSCGNSCG